MRFTMHHHHAVAVIWGSIAMVLLLAVAIATVTPWTGYHQETITPVDMTHSVVEDSEPDPEPKKRRA